MNIERKLGKIVEPFDQKDGLALGERQAKASGVRTRLTSIGKTILNVVPRWSEALRSRAKQSAQGNR